MPNSDDEKEVKNTQENQYLAGIDRQARMRSIQSVVSTELEGNEASIPVRSSGDEGNLRSALSYMRQGSLRGFRQYISGLGRDVINAPLENGRNLMHEVCARGDYGFFKAVLDAGGSVDCLDKDGNSPIHAAASSANPEAFVLLSEMIRSGGVKSFQSMSMPNNDGDTPLHLAVRAKNVKSANFLARRASADTLVATNDMGDTCFSIAASQNDSAFVKNLLNSVDSNLKKRSASDYCRYMGGLLHTRNSSGSLPLALCLERDLDCANEVFDHTVKHAERLMDPETLGDFLASSDARGFTLLHFAAESSNPMLARKIEALYSKYCEQGLITPNQNEEALSTQSLVSTGLEGNEASTHGLRAKGSMKRFSGSSIPPSLEQIYEEDEEEAIKPAVSSEQIYEEDAAEAIKPAVSSASIRGSRASRPIKRFSAPSIPPSLEQKYDEEDKAEAIKPAMSSPASIGEGTADIGPRVAAMDRATERRTYASPGRSGDERDLYLALAYLRQRNLREFKRHISGLGRDVINAPLDNGRNLIHEVCARGDYGFFKAVLDAGGSINCLDKHGNLPIHAAACSTNPEAHVLLSEIIGNGGVRGRMGISTPNNDGNTPLHLAVLAKNVKSANLLSKRASAATLVAANKMDETCLSIAASQNDSAFVKGMLNSLDSNLKKLGNTSDYHTCMGKLLHTRNSNGSLPLDLCLERGLDCADEVFDHTVKHAKALMKPEALSNFLASADEEGSTLLHSAAESSDPVLAGKISALYSKYCKQGFAIPNLNGEVPLGYAAKVAKKKVFQSILDATRRSVPEVINKPSNSGMTPLHELLLRNSTAKTSELLSSDDLHSINSPLPESGDTPLMMAVQNGLTKVVSQMLDHKSIDASKVNNKGQSAAHIAASQGDYGSIKKLLRHRAAQEGSHTPLAKDKGGYTPAMHALSSGHKNTLPILTALLPHEPSLGALALEAIKRSNMPALGSILDYGLDVNEVVQDPSYFANCDTTLLHSAVREGNLDIVKKLMKSGAKVDGVVQDSALSLALEHNWDPKGIKLLIENGADLNMLAARSGRPPLVEAIHRCRGDDQKDSLQLVQRTIAAGADVNVRAQNGDAPLHAAVKADSSKCIGLLISNKADLNARDHNGRTPVELSINLRNVKSAKSLIRSGAELSCMSDGGKGNMIHLAMQNLSDEEALKVVDAIREKHGNKAVNSMMLEQDALGRTPLHIAASNDLPKCVAACMKSAKGALEMEDASGQLPVELLSDKERCATTKVGLFGTQSVLDVVRKKSGNRRVPYILQAQALAEDRGDSEVATSRGRAGTFLTGIDIAQQPEGLGTPDRTTKLK